MIPAIGIFNALFYGCFVLAAALAGLPGWSIVLLAGYLAIGWLYARLIWVNAEPGFFTFLTVVAIASCGLVWPRGAVGAIAALRRGDVQWRARR